MIFLLELKKGELVKCKGKYMFPLLFIITKIDIKLLSKIKKKYKHSRVIFLDNINYEINSLKNIADLSEKIIVEDDIFNEVANKIKPNIIPFSKFDLKLFNSIVKVKNAKIDYKNHVFKVENGPILFCPFNDTHVKMLEPISRYLDSKHFVLSHNVPNERSGYMLNLMKLEHYIGGVEIIDKIKPSVLVLGSDWGPLPAVELIKKAKSKNIPIVCIQEGCLDFDTNKRMQWCDYPFMQGPIMTQYLDQKIYFLTGNPRFDEISQKELPQKPVVMINCNFTYGIYEDQRDKWISDIVKSCNEIGIEFFISQHPRDSGKFPHLPLRESSAEKIHNHISDSTILVSRFSTIIYEAMLMGRQVVYYNPHNEPMRLFNEDKTGGIYKVYNYKSLTDTIKNALAPISSEQKQKFNKFLDLNCGLHDEKSAYRSASAISFIAKNGCPTNNENFIKRFFKR